jgi:calcineurin-like phosphoesterase family protein
MTNEIFFTSDHHFGHKNILKYESRARPFSSVEEMDETMIDRWNSVVKKQSDLIYILGDFSFHTANETLKILERLNGKKVLICGNHDSRIIKDTSIKKYFDGDMHDYLELKFNNNLYILQHYPLITWNKCRYGAIQLFGHMHSSWAGNKCQLNVGVDTHNLFPYSMDEIHEKLATLPERVFNLPD